uniref:Uncharacterized protein n=1 Tax=Schistosoma curassoni TaxID=6186 RepID=A0A183K438_9TREM
MQRIKKNSSLSFLSCSFFSKKNISLLHFEHFKFIEVICFSNELIISSRKIPSNV